MQSDISSLTRRPWGNPGLNFLCLVPLDDAHFADWASHVLAAPLSAQDVLNATRAELASPRRAAKRA
jgi:hypothetical protein